MQNSHQGAGGRCVIERLSTSSVSGFWGCSIHVVVVDQLEHVLRPLQTLLGRLPRLQCLHTPAHTLLPVQPLVPPSRQCPGRCPWGLSRHQRNLEVQLGMRQEWLHWTHLPSTQDVFARLITDLELRDRIQEVGVLPNNPVVHLLLAEASASLSSVW